MVYLILLSEEIKHDITVRIYSPIVAYLVFTSLDDMSSVDASRAVSEWLTTVCSSINQESFLLTLGLHVQAVDAFIP